MKQCQICEESELLREVPGDVAVVEIDAGDGQDRGVVRCRSAENSGVVANTRSDPIGCEVLGIGENSFFPSLESNVGCSETRVWEDQRWTNGHKLASVSELVSVVQKLSLLDVQSFGVGEAAIDGEVGMRSSRRDEEEEEENCKGYLKQMKMKAATLRMSKLDMLAGGMWKPDMVVFMAAPCSTKREAIWCCGGEVLLKNLPLKKKLGKFGFVLGL